MERPNKPNEFVELEREHTYDNIITLKRILDELPPNVDHEYVRLIPCTMKLVVLYEERQRNSQYDVLIKEYERKMGEYKQFIIDEFDGLFYHDENGELCERDVE